MPRFLVGMVALALVGCIHDEAARYYVETKYPAKHVEDVEILHGEPSRAVDGPLQRFVGRRAQCAIVSSRSNGTSRLPIRSETTIRNVYDPGSLSSVMPTPCSEIPSARPGGAGRPTQSGTSIRSASRRPSGAITVALPRMSQFPCESVSHPMKKTTASTLVPRRDFGNGRNRHVAGLRVPELVQ